MRIWLRELGPFAANCYIIACPETAAAAIIDPGAPDPWVERTLAEHGLKASAIMLTHGHLDHIGGVEWARALTGAPVWVHGGDARMLTDAMLNGSALFEQQIATSPPDRLLQDGEELELGKLKLRVLHTPGHTPGGLCFYAPGHVITGDTLFAGSIGRTDLPGGNFSTLLHSIQTKLLPLPPETVVYPGHGPSSSIKEEQEYNPFLTGKWR